MEQPADRATRFYGRITAHPYRVLAVFAVLTVLAASQLPRIRLRTDLRELLPRDAVYADDARVREAFDIHDSIVVALVREPTVLDVPTLSYARAVAGRIADLPGVYRVRSVFSEDTIQKVDGALRTSTFIKSVNEQSVQTLKERLRSFPAVDGILVSADHTCLALIVEVDADSDRAPLCRAIEEIAAKEPSNPGARAYLAGMPVNEGVLGGYILRDLAVMLPVVFLVVMVVLYVSYRSWLLVGVALTEVLVVDIWTLGLMAFLRLPLHMVHATMPVVLMALAVADEIHIFDGYAAARAEGPADGRSAVLRAMAMLWKPVMLTSFTTALAFGSFVTSSMAPFRTYGLFTAFGVLVAMCYSLLVTPAVLALRPVRVSERLARPLASRWLGAFGGLVARRRWAFVVAILAVSALAGVGASRVYVQDSWMGNFTKDSAVRVAFNVVRQKLLGPMLLNVELDTGRPDGIKAPEFLRRLDALETQVPRLESVGGALSIGDVLKKMNREFTGRDEPPAKQGTAAEFLLILGRSYEELWRYPFQKCLVTVFCRTDDYVSGRQNYPAFKEMVEAALPGVQATYGGDFALSYHWVDLLPRNFVKSLGSSVVLVFLAVLAFSRSLRYSLLTAVPILLAVLLNFGAMGLLGIPFGVSTSMFSAIILGIGIDYAIHLQSRMDHLGRGLPRCEAVAAAFGSTGRAIMWDAVVVCAGFLVLLLSDMPPNRSLGLMVSLGIAVSLVSTCFLLPALWSPGRRQDGG